MKYLENFPSLMAAVQGNLLVNRVDKMRQTGEIQTEAEYKEALQELLSNISTVEYKPTFEYIRINPDISSSEHINYMFDLARDDLSSLFTELNNIFVIIKAHDGIFKDKFLDEMHFTLKELENKAENLAIINDPTNMFDNVFVNTFSGENFSLERTSPEAKRLLFDKRKAIDITDQSLGYINNKEEILSLPLLSEQGVPFIRADIIKSDTTVSEVNVSSEDSDIDYLLDEDISSSWIYNILSLKPLKTGAELVLELDLGDKQEINYLVVHPIADFPMFLDTIEYQDINNNIQTLPDTTYFNKVIDKPVRITFPDIIAKKITIKLLQFSSGLFDYDRNRPRYVFDDLKRNPELKERGPSLLTDGIKESIQDPDLLGVIPLESKNEESFQTYYQYVFGFKFISAGLSTYRDNGYFISRGYSKESLGLIGFEADAVIPTYFNEEVAEDQDIGSLEFDLTKKDYDGLGNPVGVLEFPVLPIGVSEVKNERLFFTEIQPVVSLRFLAHDSNNKGSDIVLYRNGLELIRGVDWRFFDRVNPLDDADNNIKPEAVSTRIEILHDSNIVKTGKYLSDYIPRYIKEPNGVHSLSDIVYLPNGTTEHKITKGAQTIEMSDLFLKISIRNNSPFSNKTPKLNSYKILTSSVNSEKYKEI